MKFDKEGRYLLANGNMMHIYYRGKHPSGDEFGFPFCSRRDKWCKKWCSHCNFNGISTKCPHKNDGYSLIFWDFDGYAMILNGPNENADPFNLKKRLGDLETKVIKKAKAKAKDFQKKTRKTRKTKKTKKTKKTVSEVRIINSILSLSLEL